MSLFVLMRFLESAPERYDRGMHFLFQGGLEEAYRRLAERILPGQRILDLGCGTGSFGLQAVQRGARVLGIDRDSGMLAVAARRIEAQGLGERFQLQERGAAELDREEPCSRDAVLAGLVFSELGADELDFTLRQVERILKPGGLLLVAEEVTAPSAGLRVLHALFRAPVAGLTWLLTHRVSRPVRALPAKVAQAGLQSCSTRRSRAGGFLELVARKPERKE